MPTIHSVCSGVVIDAGPIWDDAGNLKGYGCYVEILEDDGVVVLYAYLASELEVTCGAPVELGTGLGVLGSTGRSSGTHLHLELRKLDDPDP